MTSSAFVVAAAMTAAMTVTADAAPPRPDPSDPKAGTPPLRYQTGLEPAKPAAEFDPTRRWREHNERVRAIGGHAGYLRDGGSASDAKPAGDAAGKR
jgi:hypothetical protein